MTTSTTFGQALDSALGSDPSRPFVTFYDDATGERVELSVTTYANWVDKTAGLLQDELDAERGDVVLVDLPVHWLGAVWLGAAWRAGLTVTPDADRVEEAAVVVCGPEGLPRYADAAGPDRSVVALSLRPLGGRFAEALPAGVVDYNAVVLAQPDSFLALDPPEAGDAAWLSGGTSYRQEEVLADAAASPLVEAGGRLLTDVNPCTERGLPTLLAPLLADGGTVWVAHADVDRWAARAEEERATAELRAGA